MSAEEVAKAFVQHFYTSFDSNVENLKDLYVSKSYVNLVCAVLRLAISFAASHHSMYYGAGTIGGYCWNSVYN